MQKRRRARLAAPIVVTVAVTAGCTPVQTTANPPYPEDLHMNPPPQPSATEVPTATPTAAPSATAKVAEDLPLPSGKLKVSRLPDGSCVEMPDMSHFRCLPNRTCNPPPLRPVRCPESK